MSNKALNNIGIKIAPVLAHLLIRFIALTMRKTYVNLDKYRSVTGASRQIILAFWHGRLMMMPYSYFGGRITILVSQHRDGELICRTVKGFGIESVRGSSTRGWIGGIKGLLKSVKDGRDLAITPDGPKGPALKAQMGALQLARATGLPIVPATFNAKKKKYFAVGTVS